MYRFFLCVSLLMVVMLIGPTYLEACPACKTLDDPIAKGFNFSILFLMAMPFTVFGVIEEAARFSYITGVQTGNRRIRKSSTKNSC